MDKIYVFGIRGATNFGDIQGFAVDGFVVDKTDGKKKLNSIAGHLSSGEAWSKHDMGITSDWHHDEYKKAHPNGYELEFLGFFDSVSEVREELEGKLEMIE